MADLKEYIRNLEIENPRSAFPVAKGEEAPTVKSGEDQSFLSAKSVVSFVAGVKDQARQDVLDSMLLAQLAANKSFPSEENVIQWYEKFISVLSTVGWNIEGKDLQQFKSDKGLFEVDKAIIAILTTAFGGTLLPVIMQTLKALRELNGNKSKLLAFEKNVHSKSQGAFQIGSVEEENGALSAQLGTFVISSKKEIRQILFFSSDKDETDLKYYSKKMTLNQGVYNSIREDISKKIHAKVSDYVAQIEI
jgi:hypothetical protein